jgi:hypothetical protein
VTGGERKKPDAVFIFGGAACPDFGLNIIVDGKTVRYEIDRVQLIVLLSQGFDALKTREVGLP